MSLSTSPNSDHLGSRGPKQASQLALSGEINADSIRALDEQIGENERSPTIIKLKRARNSLLNVSKLPPEVLGEIFHWNVTLKDDFDGLGEESHNFLLVCHHWFQVASRTPELWSFWGNIPEDWMRWSPHSRTAPLDLVLDQPIDGYYEVPDATLFNELQDRATKNTIRRIHLRAESVGLMSSVISSLTAKREGTRPNNVESVILWNWGGGTVDMSDFFTRYRFPKLRHLKLTRCAISSWNHLTSRTGALTVLSLNFPSPTPTMSQLLSIIASNPLLQDVTLSSQAIPQNDGSPPSARVPLHNLKKLELAGGLRDVFRLLHQLDHPIRMDSLRLTLDNCKVAEISQIIGPHLRGYLRDRGRSRHELGLLISPGNSIILHVDGERRTDWPLVRIDTFLLIMVRLDRSHRNEGERATLDLIAHIPGEDIVHFETFGSLVTTENICSWFPNLRTITFERARLQTIFPEPDQGRDEDTLLSLQRMCFRGLVVDHGNWRPLITFLACRISSGNRLDTLEVCHRHPMSREVIEVVRGMVRELIVKESGPPDVAATDT